MRFRYLQESPEVDARTSRGTTESGTASQAERAEHSPLRRRAKTLVREKGRSALQTRRKDFWLSPAGKRLERIGSWARCSGWR
jgi:hypothetical protein